MYRHCFKYLLLLIVMAATSGCVDDRTPQEEPLPSDTFYLRVSLRLPDAGNTRANPDGGETGNGREHALPRENVIRNFNIFIYSLSEGNEGGNGLNAANPGNVKISCHIYQESENENGFTITNVSDDDKHITAETDEIVIPLADYKPGDNDWAIVVANCGEINGMETLADLRDKVFEGSCWKGSRPRESTEFTMASAHRLNKDGRIIKTNKTGSQDNPFTLETTIERTAARIDFWYDGAKVNADKNAIIYDVKGKNHQSAEDAVVAQVKLTHILPVNMMQQPSYYFKHTTTDFSLSPLIINVCKPENPVSGKPVNYVIEPTTLSKANGSAPDAKTLFGMSRTEYIRGNKDAFLISNSVSTMLANGESFNYSENDWNADANRYTIVSYANENTMTGKEFPLTYMTGLAFKAIYIPVQVYSDFDKTSMQLTKAVYKEGEDLWRFSPTTTDMDENGSVYFSNQEAATAYQESHPDDKGIITLFEKGECFYNLWIKHAEGDWANGEPEEPFEMMYAIVRNNIYRVAVSFSGPGTPTPEMNTPVNMKSRIFVRRWNLRTEDTIIF